jgi:hypothetical protein
VKCIAWNFDGSNMFEKKKDLKKIRFENGDPIPNMGSYFVFNDDDDSDDDDDNDDDDNDDDDYDDDDSDDDGDNNVNNDYE